MLVRTFGAPSFDQFWRYWNPVYGYLYYRCYRPLRRFFPRAVCVLLTFAASGFLLHDLPFGWWIRLIRSIETVPFVTLWFCLMGALTLVSRALGWNMSSLPMWVRVTLNSLGIVGTFVFARWIAQLMS